MLILNRLPSSDLLGTYGTFVLNNRPICHSLELPWRSNDVSVSCIPVGDYEVIKAHSPRFGDTFYFKNVPGRTGILIHPGNSLIDTRGCILPGLDLTDNGLQHSRLAMKRLYANLPDKFTISIRKVLT